MGCFQSKNTKAKAKPTKLPKSFFGEFNPRWQRLLQTRAVKSLIIDDINHCAPHPAFESIDKDVSRTFPHQQFFTQPENISLFKQVLKCFALTFPKVGYTQGLNFICGYFLINEMDKPQCLTMLSSLMSHPSLMCLGLYEDGFPLAVLYCELFWEVLKKVDGQLHDCLKQIGISDHMWIFQWYLTFFLYSFPLEYIPFWFTDLFEHKEFEMVKISVGIVQCLREDILQMAGKDDISLLEYLQTLKDVSTCTKTLNLQQSLQHARAIDNSLITECLHRIKQTTQNKNIYLTYFTASHKEQKPLYSKFVKQIKSSKVQLQQSKHDEKLMESYKRSRHTVEILDEILLLSVNKQKEKQYQSSYEARRHGREGHVQMRRWKSLVCLDEVEAEKEGEGETTVSVVRKMVIPEEE